MRILFSTTAGAGHFGPLVPFARAAARAGHDVLVAAPAEFRPAVEAAGFAFAPFAGRSDADAGAMFARIEAATSLEEGNRIMIRDGFGGLYPRAALPALLGLVDEWRPDVIVRETAEFASLAVAIGRGIPRAHVAIGLLGLMDVLGGTAMEALAEVAAEHALTIPSDTSPFVEEPTLTLTPPTFDDPGEGTHRYRELLETIEPDPSLAGEDPLVYLTFGTEAAGFGLFPDLYRAAIGALAGGGWRVLATIGRAADPAALGTLPPGVRVEQWIPQDAVMPHAAVVVFHGGYGTMLGALRSGVPLVTMPLFSIDQVANAKRSAERGIGVSIAGPEALGELPAAVATVLGDPRFRSAAEVQAEAIRALASVEDSVAVLTALAGSGG
jgi:UDP:flavonoid glycosyltransferase YjiC (YdhE family)